MNRRDHPPRITWAVAILGALFGTGCSGEAEPPTAGQLLREGVDMVIFQMRTFVTREGIRRARLEADTAEFLGENEIHMRPVSLTFFDDEGRESTVITADFGIFYELTEDMEAEGSVVVLDEADDQRLETERLRYVRAEDRLYGEVPFTLWSDGGLTRLEGSEFESDPNLDSFRVPSPSGSSERPPRPAAESQIGDPSAEAAQLGLDSAAVAEDSVSVPDSLATPPDTITTGPPPDTTTTEPPPDTTAAPPDTVRVARGRPAPTWGSGER